jgi:arginyl-tRNA synthetase
MKKRIFSILNKAVERASDEGILKSAPAVGFVVEVPSNPAHGHFATNLCLALAKSQKQPPMKIASLLLPILRECPLFDQVDAAAPGFINFFVKRTEWISIILQILQKGASYGKSAMGAGKSVLVEFVSANPTGPLHLGHGRGAALGDTLCRILELAGFNVGREFYINDAGKQIRLLGESVFARWQQIENPDYPFPADGYHGEYVSELARMISAETDLTSLSDEEAIELCASKGKNIMLEDIKRSLNIFRVDFDVWYSETSLHESGRFAKSLSSGAIAEKIYEKDGALWIATSEYGDDKDRVIRKQDGSYTYFASDISYHRDKWERGFNRAIDIWGADHHGYIMRVQAALETMGVPKGWLSVLLIQLVKLWKEGAEVRMSKRAGTYVTLQELMDEVGVDAARFVFLTKHNDSPLDVDVDLIKRQESDNPVFYVQYAHARASSILRKAQEEKVSSDNWDERLLQNCLKLEEEIGLIRMMGDFPTLVEEMAESLEPHRLTYYLQELASLFHRYFNLGTKNPELRVITEDVSMTRARLCLVKAIRTVIANGLSLLAISAPEQM